MDIILLDSFSSSMKGELIDVTMQGGCKTAGMDFEVQVFGPTSSPCIVVPTALGMPCTRCRHRVAPCGTAWRYPPLPGACPPTGIANLPPPGQLSHGLERRTRPGPSPGGKVYYTQISFLMQCTLPQLEVVLGCIACKPRPCRPPESGGCYSAFPIHLREF